jgi:uncharacterized membrane protein
LKDKRNYTDIAGEYMLIYAAGAVIYSLIEIMWRGYTHWTMALAGGLCFSCIYFTENCFKHKRLWLKCCVGCVIITTVEFSVGCLVNRILDWRVWDYSNHRLNFFGQICLLYMVMWYVLCGPAYLLCGYIKRLISGRKASNIKY